MPNEVTYPVRVLRQQATEFEAAISVCLAEPTVRAVHRLRTGTRRVEAQLLLLSFVPGVPEHREEAAQLGRELRRLRRVAGEVRDFDVHRKHLESLSAAPAGQATGATSAGEGAAPAAKPTAQEGTHDLLQHLEKKREKAAVVLQKLLAHHQAKAATAAERLLKVLHGAGNLRVSAPDLVRYASAVLQRDGLLAQPGPDKLDEDELHTVRKSAKAARYVAETLPGNTVAEGAAQRFEAVQEAGGQWHDTVEITAAARRYLGKHHALTLAFAAEAKVLRRAYRQILHKIEPRPSAKPAKQPKAKPARQTLK